jgi:hypothetical protein
MNSPGNGERLASAARDVQAFKGLQAAQGTPKPRKPVANQPLLRAPEEMAEERASADTALYKGRLKGQRDAEVETLRELGATDDEIQAAMYRRISGQNTPRSIPMQSQNWVDAQGVPFSVMWNPDPTASVRYLDETGQPFDPSRMDGARRIGVGPIVQWSVQTDDFGNVSMFALDRNTPQLMSGGISAPPGVQGRTSPAGPVVLVQGPDGAPSPSRLGRTGTELSPITVPTPPGGGPRQPAVGYRPETQTVLDQINFADSGLQLLSILEQSFDPRYTGIIQGRWNAWNQKYNPFSEADPNFKTFSMNWATARNELMRINAGLTQTPQEKANIEAQIMSLNDKDDNFLPGLQVVRNHFQRKLDVMKQNAGHGIPFVNQGNAIPAPPGAPQQAAPPQNQTVPNPPAFSDVPGRGVQLRHKQTGQTKWVVDPALVDFALKQGDFEQVR